MFHKPFKVKSQTSIKGSDRKKLRAEMSKQFPEMPEEQLKEVVPNKDEMNVTKVYTHSGDNVTIYCLQKNPAFFEVNGRVYPTVYTLWKHLDLVPSFTTWPPVFTKLAGGADLMLPGVVVRGEVTPHSLGNLHKGAPCCIRLLGNRSPVAVGRTALSSSDMFEAGMKGKGVIVLHTYRDYLWAHGDKSDPPLIDEPIPEEMQDTLETPDVGAGTEGDAAVAEAGPEAGQMMGDASSREDNHDAPMAGASQVDGATGDICDGIEGVHISEDEKTAEGVHDEGEAAAAGEEEEEVQEVVNEQDDGRTPQEKMDDLLYQCCLQAIKTNVNKADLPLLSSKFFKSHLQPCCPPNESIDVKKSSYKKLTKFLGAMQKQGILKVKELSKGVESITEIHKEHPEVRAFVVPELPPGGAAETLEGTSGEYQPPQIQEMFTVTAATLPLFQARGKGAALTAADVKKVVTEYVKTNELQARGGVKLDGTLCDIVLTRDEYIELMSWEDLLKRMVSKMSPAHQLVYPGQPPIFRKGKLEPVTMTIAQRAGNKKVTLIENLELFGIDPEEFAHQVQLGVACSTSVSQLPGKNRGSQVLVQGNQIHFIADLLTGKYKLAKKYLQGLEKAPKAKKKK